MEYCIARNILGQFSSSIVGVVGGKRLIRVGCFTRTREVRNINVGFLEKNSCRVARWNHVGDGSGTEGHSLKRITFN
jgi:hypothetical protein